MLQYELTVIVAVLMVLLISNISTISDTGLAGAGPNRNAMIITQRIGMRSQTKVVYINVVFYEHLKAIHSHILTGPRVIAHYRNSYGPRWSSFLKSSSGAEEIRQGSDGDNQPSHAGPQVLHFSIPHYGGCWPRSGRSER